MVEWYEHHPLSHCEQVVLILFHVWFASCLMIDIYIYDDVGGIQTHIMISDCMKYTCYHLACSDITDTLNYNEQWDPLTCLYRSSMFVSSPFFVVLISWCLIHCIIFLARAIFFPKILSSWKFLFFHLFTQVLGSLFHRAFSIVLFPSCFFHHAFSIILQLCDIHI